MMAGWMHVLCVGFIALILVVGANGCDCSRKHIRKVVCKPGQGPCFKTAVDESITNCLLRCKKKRTDPTQAQDETRQHFATRPEQLWDDVYGIPSGDSQCLLDDIFHKLTPVWQEEIIKLLKQAVSVSDK